MSAQPHSDIVFPRKLLNLRCNMRIAIYAPPTLSIHTGNEICWNMSFHPTVGRVPFNDICSVKEFNYTHMQKDLPQPPLRPAVLLAGRSSTDERAYPPLIPPAGDGRESRGTSPSGAVCGRPPAAQADKTAISSAHEYSFAATLLKFFSVIVIPFIVFLLIMLFYHLLSFLIICRTACL